MDLFDVLVVAVFSAVLASAVGIGLYNGGFFAREPAEPQAEEFRNSKLVSVILSLDEHAVGRLLDLYRSQFGAGPARYARKTFQKWRSGQVRPATQTFERFLVHLPKVMPYDLKCEVLRRFMEEFANKDTYELDVTTEDWEAKLEPLVRQIIDKAYTAQLPREVEEKLQWLGDGDMVAAHQLLRASQAEEGRIMVSMLRDEFRAFDMVLSARHLKPKVIHVLEFPYGSIRLNIKRSNGGNG